MTRDELMTYGAIGFALFAAWYVLRKPSAPGGQSGQAQRDASLAEWNQQHASQWAQLGPAMGYSIDQISNLMDNPFAGATP